MSVEEEQLTHADRELRARLTFILAALIVVFTLGWVAWFYPYDDLFDRSGMQLGGDFPVFYVQARFAAAGRWKDLYNFEEQGREMRRFLPGMPEGKFLPALYPPWTAVLLRPLAYFSYPAAYAVFVAASVALLVLTVWTWTKVFPLARGPWRNVVWLSAFGFPAVLETLISGQASALAAAILGIGAALLQSKRPFAAGLVFGLAAYKPTVLTLVVLGVALRSRATFLGCVATVGALAALSHMIIGPDAERDYVAALRDPKAQQAIENPPTHKFHGLAASTPMTRSGTVRKALLLVGVVVLLFGFRTPRDEEQRGEVPIFLAALGTLHLLANPYLPIYDLALLYPIAFLFLDGLSERYGPSVGRHVVLAHVALALLFFGPYVSQGIAQATGWQPFMWLSVPAFVWSYREYRSSSGASPKRTPA